MAQCDLKLLDCTLRDGGYINDWNWGFSRAREIIRCLIKAKIEIIEVGFLRDVEDYRPDITVCNQIEELNRLIPDEDIEYPMFSAMAMRSNYDILKLSDYCGRGIEMIRITAHDYDLKDGMEFARKVKEKGYRLSINPINIMGYSDSQILRILERVNEILPYQFSIVDTFGSMKRHDLDRIVSLVDHNLDKNIRVALHLHENMSLSSALAQNFVERHLSRPIAVDASLMGIGRTPGNLPIELIADYLNDCAGKSYDIDHLMDAIQDYVSPLKGESAWGYMPAYFLSARFNLHRNYAEYYLKKGDLTNRDINHILSRFERDKTTVFDAYYADLLYEEYKNHHIDDRQARLELKTIFTGKKVLLIAPGSSIKSYREIISDYIRENNPLVLSVNFVPDIFKTDFAFFSNHKRYDRIDDFPCSVIATSNIARNAHVDFIIDYNSLTGAFNQGCNSLIMALKLLKDMDTKRITIAGADGYIIDGDNYYDNTLRSYVKHGNQYNLAVADAIRNLDMTLSFLTPSAYMNDNT